MMVETHVNGKHNGKDTGESTMMIMTTDKDSEGPAVFDLYQDVKSQLCQYKLYDWGYRSPTGGGLKGWS